MRSFIVIACKVAAALLACALILYQFHSWPAGRFVPTQESNTFRHLFRHTHRIEQLHSRAVERHQALIRRQSQDVETAIDTYRRQHKIEPPPGFERWFEVAQAWNSSIIDDFQLIRHQLRPFDHYLSNKYDLNLTNADRGVFPFGRLLQVCFGGPELQFVGYQESWFVEGLQKLFAPFANDIPELCILINLLDEPRVILPEGALPAALQPQSHSLSFRDIRDHKNLWSEISLPCWSSRPDDETVTLETDLRHAPSIANRPRDIQVVYAEDWWENTDICMKASPMQNSFIMSPASAKLTHDTVPILSPAKLSTFSDILFPGIWRFVEAPEQEDDPDWDSKAPKIYWRGSTTGGHATDAKWRHFHRQALITGLRDAFASHPEQLDVAFTDVIQCEAAVCDEERESLPMSDWAPRGEGYQNKLVLDVDGNGLSGRLYDLLRSKSAVVRHSFMREWHDERLQPWLHYIPLTSEATELPELAEFFFNTERGDEILRNIAEAGKSWAERSLRHEDMALYFYRLLLEMGRDRPQRP